MVERGPSSDFASETQHVNDDMPSGDSHGGPEMPLQTQSGRPPLLKGRELPDLRNLAAGCRLGKHLLLRAIGQGGMGVVYEAEDTFLRRRVAVKVIARGLDAEAEGRFLREAQSAAGLSHPNVVAVHEIDEHEGTVYLVMELAPAGSVQSLLRQR